ncbi:SpaA isopeptide-forming pilin-related protein [Candidatus Stoquefichus massiliensis]|uniref:SpaA isopeptide-forming pilin-related protein n=1 Tax=Candidatus Stoquefichus massiliensis TaxID=1470350 RepID=UPI00048618C9|nr:SpaA isopeptide-forming pilin-related protein [Candidatus Stoquefichus massiliensis]
MKVKIKKVFVGIMSLLMMLTLVSPSSVYAETYVTGSKKHPTWWLAEPSSGRRDDHEAELLINGERVFCIDAFTQFKSNQTMNIVDWSTVGISQEMSKELSLIAYFGTQVDGRKADDWYAITQGLIWKVLHESQGHTDMCYVETNTNPDYPTTVRLWNEILSDVEQYKKIPSFSNTTVEVDADKSITLTDVNNSLNGMIVKDNGGLNITINGSNQLVINGSADANETTTITLQRNIDPSAVGTSLAFYNGKTQSVGMFKIKDPLQVKLRVKVNKFGKLELTKYNEDKSSTVPETSYRITGPNGFDETHKTDPNGKIILDRLAIGEYKATETQAGTGYLINTTEFGFTIKPNETTTIDPSNIEPKGKIELNKQIDTTNTNGLVGDAYLKDITFGLYAKEKIVNKANTKTFYEKNELVSQGKTNSDGKIMWDDLPLGNYYIKELNSNNSLVLNNQTIDIVLEYQGQTVKKVIKSKKVTNRVNMQKIQVFKSGEKDGISGIVKGLQGAEFTFKLKTEVDHVGWDNATTYAQITTDKNGIANTPYLPYGQYLVKETVTPKDFITAPDFLISVSDDYSEYTDIEQVKRVNINNRPFTSQVKLVKKDKETGEKVTLNSATFKIKDEDGNYVVQKVFGKKIDAFTTNSKNHIVSIFGDKGEITLPLSLNAGTYTIDEIKVPSGFLQLEKPVKFTITNQYDYDLDQDNEPILEVIVKNAQPKGKIILQKIDKETSKPLSHVEYELTAKENIINVIDGSILFKKGSVVAKGITDLKGQFIIDNLFMGHYGLKETLTNDGYVLSEEVHDIVLEQKDLTTKEYVVNVNVTNIAPIGEIHLIKTDKDTQELLSGVIYQLTASEDIYSLDGRNTLIYKEGETVSKDISEDGLYMTNELGEIHISNLPLGRYKIKEIKALDGYATDQKQYEIDLSYDGSNKTIYTHNLNLTNSKTSIEISKKDISTSQELAGAQLTLFDKDNNIVETWTSATEPHIIRGLNIGEKYRLHEDLAPLGYTKASDIEFTVEDSKEIQKIEMIDDIIRVEISKQDITNGKELAGAKLQIIDFNNKIIHEWISTDKPELFEKLPAGEYILREISAPEGYEIAEDVKFTVNEMSEIQKVVMKDAPSPKIEVPKTGDSSYIGVWLLMIGVTTCTLGFIKNKKKNDDDKIK